MHIKLELNVVVASEYHTLEVAEESHTLELVSPLTVMDQVCN